MTATLILGLVTGCLRKCLSLLNGYSSLAAIISVFSTKYGMEHCEKRIAGSKKRRSKLIARYVIIKLSSYLGAKKNLNIMLL
jgi:hypothetical protein